jgi:hypothetical protein
MVLSGRRLKPRLEGLQPSVDRELVSSTSTRESHPRRWVVGTKVPSRGDLGRSAFPNT